MAKIPNTEKRPLKEESKLIGKTTCLTKVLKLEDSELVGFKILTANHRNPILTEITKYLENE